MALLSCLSIGASHGQLSPRGLSFSRKLPWLLPLVVWGQEEKADPKAQVHAPPLPASHLLISQGPPPSQPRGCGKCCRKGAQRRGAARPATRPGETTDGTQPCPHGDSACGPTRASPRAEESSRSFVHPGVCRAPAARWVPCSALGMLVKRQT